MNKVKLCHPNYFLPLLQVFLVLATTSISLQAMSQDNSSSKSEQAVFLQGVTNQLTQINQISGDFKQSRIIPGLPHPLISNGTFDYQKNKITWHTHHPLENIVVITPDKAVQTDSQGNSMELNSGIFSSIFLGIFSGNMEALSSYLGINTEGDLHAWCLIFHPEKTEAKKHLSQVKVCGGDFIKQIQISTPQNDITRVEFTAKAIEKEHSTQPD